MIALRRKGGCGFFCGATLMAGCTLLAVAGGGVALALATGSGVGTGREAAGTEMVSHGTAAAAGFSETATSGVTAGVASGAAAGAVSGEGVGVTTAGGC